MRWVWVCSNCSLPIEFFGFLFSFLLSSSSNDTFHDSMCLEPLLPIPVSVSKRACNCSDVHFDYVLRVKSHTQTFESAYSFADSKFSFDHIAWKTFKLSRIQSIECLKKKIQRKLNTIYFSESERRIQINCDRKRIWKIIGDIGGFCFIIVESIGRKKICILVQQCVLFSVERKKKYTALNSICVYLFSRKDYKVPEKKDKWVYWMQIGLKNRNNFQEQLK